MELRFRRAELVRKSCVILYLKRNAAKKERMNDLDNQAFSALFKDAFEKCFGHALAGPMSETESKQFYNRIFSILTFLNLLKLIFRSIFIIFL